MEEKVIAKSSIARWGQIFYTVLIIIEILVTLTYLVIAIIKGSSPTTAIKNPTAVQSGPNQGKYECVHAFETFVFSTKMEYSAHYEKYHSANSNVHFYTAVQYYVRHLVYLALTVITFLSAWFTSKANITVTDKHVYGRTAFGKTVFLPIYQITSVFTARFFSRIMITTSRGIIYFHMIENNKDLALKIRNLIIQRQEETEFNREQPEDSYIEELQRLKALLDGGAITQEEFDVKKKELLAIEE